MTGHTGYPYPELVGNTHRPYVPILLVADINGDENIDIPDLIILSGYRASQGAYRADYDMNGDGAVDDLDITALCRVILDSAA